jgi:hypothetical protein
MTCHSNLVGNRYLSQNQDLSNFSRGLLSPRLFASGLRCVGISERIHQAARYTPNHSAQSENLVLHRLLLVFTSLKRGDRRTGTDFYLLSSRWRVPESYC